MFEEVMGYSREAEPQPNGSSLDPFELIEDEKLLCARTNMLQLSNGDALSKELVAELLEPVSDTEAQFKCPVTVCPVIYELDAEHGSEKRRGDCAVVMAGIMKTVGKRSRGLSFEEFAQTPLGKKTIK
jgi:hypothetical protein